MLRCLKLCMWSSPVTLTPLFHFTDRFKTGSVLYDVLPAELPESKLLIKLKRCALSSDIVFFLIYVAALRPNAG